MQYRPEHTWPCVPAAVRRQDSRIHEDTRMSLIGNWFHAGVVGWLLGQVLTDWGVLDKRPTVQQVVDGRLEHLEEKDASPLSLDDSASQLQLVRFYFHRQTHRGGEVRLQEGPTMSWATGTQALDPRMWRWKTVIGTPWKHKGEHINALEGRGYGLTIRWRCRRFSALNSRWLHLVDSMVTMGGASKGRTSATSLQGIVKANNALLLISCSYPFLAYFRSHSNPADRPLRPRVVKS